MRKERMQGGDNERQRERGKERRDLGKETRK